MKTKPLESARQRFRDNEKGTVEIRIDKAESHYNVIENKGWLKYWRRGKILFRLDHSLLKEAYDVCRQLIKKDEVTNEMYVELLEKLVIEMKFRLITYESMPRTLRDSESDKYHLNWSGIIEFSFDWTGITLREKTYTSTDERSKIDLNRIR